MTYFHGCTQNLFMLKMHTEFLLSFTRRTTAFTMTKVRPVPGYSPVWISEHLDPWNFLIVCH